jgi:hypothetical protein
VSEGSELRPYQAYPNTMPLEVSLNNTATSRVRFDGDTILTVNTAHDGGTSDFTDHSDEDSNYSGSDVEPIEPETKPRKNRTHPRIRVRLRSAGVGTATSSGDGEHTQERRTYENYRPVGSVHDPWAQPPAPLGYSRSLPDSALNTVSSMSSRDLRTFLEGLSRGSTLSDTEKGSLLDMLAMEVRDRTTIVLSGKGTEFVRGPEYTRESAIAAFVAEELEDRKWAIKEKSSEGIYELICARGPLDGDAVHEVYRWLIVPSKLKLLAYKHGHQGLTEEDRQKEIKVMRDVALKLLIGKSTNIEPHCACERKYIWTNDFSACHVS